MPSTLDAEDIIRGARHRRLPKLIGFGSVATLAVVGISVVGFNVIQLPQSAIMSASDSSGGAESNSMPQAPTFGYDLLRAPADKVNLCGGLLAEVTPSETGLVLTTNFPASAPADGQPLTGTVTLTNTGSERVTGTTAASPAVTLSKDGLTLWHSNGPMIALAVLVDLEPGESMDYPASLTPVECGAEDKLADGFRDNLPALPVGDYQVSAVIDLVPDPIGSGESQRVAGPLQTVSLR